MAEGSRFRRRVLLGALAAAAVVVGALSPAALAGKPFQDRFHDEVARPGDTVCGMTVDYTLSLDIAIHIVPHGPDGLEYWNVRGKFAESFTANGKTATAMANVLEKDLKVTDNGDGSATIVELATGNATLYGPDGKAIARDPGQLRYLLYVAPDGTVTRGPVVKPSTGRSDDFCSALVSALS